MPPQGRLARRVLVDGRVQGVGFRWHTRAEARALGLVGSVQNLADGRVEVHVEGPSEAVRALEAWLHRGPSGAYVAGVEVCDVAPRHPASFEIVR